LVQRAHASVDLMTILTKSSCQYKIGTPNLATQLPLRDLGFEERVRMAASERRPPDLAGRTGLSLPISQMSGIRELPARPLVALPSQAAPAGKGGKRNSTLRLDGE